MKMSLSVETAPCWDHASSPSRFNRRPENLQQIRSWLRGKLLYKREKKTQHHGASNRGGKNGYKNPEKKMNEQHKAADQKTQNRGEPSNRGGAQQQGRQKQGSIGLANARASALSRVAPRPEQTDEPKQKRRRSRKARISVSSSVFVPERKQIKSREAASIDQVGYSPSVSAPSPQQQKK